MKSPMNNHSDELSPLSSYDTLTAQLAKNPHDPDGWKRLVHIAEASGDLAKIGATYDALLKQYPNNARAQIQFTNHFLNIKSTFETAKNLFQKFLSRSPCVDLWTFYLNYVRQINVEPAKQNNIQLAYEFALDHVGQDKDSGSIWSDYIQFLKKGETTSEYEEQQKTNQLRKTYHRAVQIPLDNVERLWSDLEIFETNLNKITAKKIMADLSSTHIKAKMVLHQLIKHLAPIYCSNLRELYLPSLPEFTVSERVIVGKWKAYLKWEESNPLEIEEKDKAVLITRIRGAYRKAMIHMKYYTEIWFLAYTWTKSIGKESDAISILKSGLEANPSSFLLTFTYAEALEIKQSLPEVHTTYERFLNILRTNLDILEKACTSDTTSILNSQKSYDDHNSQQASWTNLSNAEPKGTELLKHRTEYGLTWVMYIRFAMRSEGTRSFRIVFTKAMKDRWTPWEVFEAAALMEYHHSDDKSAANRIFEKGLTLHQNEIDYVVRYLTFLISVNDESNARALFERVISNFPPDRARPLWQCWSYYEYQYGDLERSLKMEKRISKVYSSDSPIKCLAQRYAYLGTDAIAERDLGVAMVRCAPKSGSSPSLGCNKMSHSFMRNSQPTNTGNLTLQGRNNKRPPSSEHHDKPENENTSKFNTGHKRQRAVSPMGPDRETNRETRWDRPSRRFSSPFTNQNDRGNVSSGRPRQASVPPHQEREKDESKRELPGMLNYFIGQLPPAASFSGPMFRVDDIMHLFQTADIPRTSERSKSSLLQPPQNDDGRPPSTYGSHHGPSGRLHRRY